MSITLGKGKSVRRRIVITDGIRDLQLWMNIRPFKENPDSPLFISFSKKNKFKSFESGGFNGIIKGLAHVNMLWCRLT